MSIKLKLEVIVPKGWRLLKKGETIKRGDRYAETVKAAWVISSAIGSKAFDNFAPHRFYIRKTVTKGEPCKKKKGQPK